MTKHTPGPWHYSGHGDRVTAIVSGKHLRVAKINPACELPLEEDSANARLIAAAPELLESVKDLLGIIRTVCPEYEEATMCANARAAIAKAKGSIA